MRPRRLVLTAFGPFPGVVDLDFSTLDDTGVFLIHGPTGAGKTTILDGITYALYGEVGGGRQRDRLRSDHAEATMDTAVAFEFTLRSQDWRITRAPKQERARRRGQGTTVQAPTATLCRRSAQGWEPVAVGVVEVGMAVAAEIGLDRVQFQQVVILPQGRVQEALRASAHDRERLLSSLFDAGRFEDHTVRLAERAHRLEADVVRGEHALEVLRGQAADRADELDADAWEPIASQADLDALCSRARAASAVTAAAVAATQAQAAAAADALLAAELLAERCRRRIAAEQKLAAIERHAAETAALRARAVRAEAAAPCAPLLQALDEAEAAHASAVERQSAAASATIAATRGLPDGLVGDGTDMEHLGRLAARIEWLAEEAAQGEHEIAAAHASRRAAVEHRARADELDTHANEAEARAAEHGAEAAAAAQAANRLDDLAAAVSALADRAAAAAELVDLERTCADALSAETASAAAHREALRRHTGLLQRRIDGMAAELAAALADGEPCAVCGSTTHPAPAATGAAAAGSAEIDAAAAEAERLGHAAEDARRRSACIAEALAELRTRAGGAAPSAAADALAGAETELAAAQALAERLAAVQQRVRELSAAAERDRTQAGAEREHAAGALSAAAASAARAATIGRTLTDELGRGADPAAVARRLSDLIDQTRRLEAARVAGKTACEQMEAARSRFNRSLAASGFDRADDLRAAMAAAADLTRWRRQIADHDRRRAAALAVLEEPGLGGLPDPPPNIEAAREAGEQARKARDEAVARHSVVQRAAAEAERLAERHRVEAAALAPVRADAERVRRLASLCDGSGNHARMSLKRYVLAAYLEEITAAASDRLQTMTDGRYHLRHSDHRARHGAASGLSIMAGDAWTGVERDVGSLSGGETFQAALAFALGIADVVQRYTGGMHLDTLFVDEGFGALDPEALEAALAELDRLREGGRLVGVVSHVAALRERIPAGIHVHRTAAGSTASVQTL